MRQGKGKKDTKDLRIVPRPQIWWTQRKPSLEKSLKIAKKTEDKILKSSKRGKKLIGPPMCNKIDRCIFKIKNCMWSYCVLMLYFILLIIIILGINLDTILFKIIFLLTGWWSGDVIHVSQLMWLLLASTTQLSALIRNHYHLLHDCVN